MTAVAAKTGRGPPRPSTPTTTTARAREAAPQERHQLGADQQPAPVDPVAGHPRPRRQQQRGGELHRGDQADQRAGAGQLVDDHGGGQVLEPVAGVGHQAPGEERPERPVHQQRPRTRGSASSGPSGPSGPWSAGPVGAAGVSAGPTETRPPSRSPGGRRAGRVRARPRRGGGSPAGTHGGMWGAPASPSQRARESAPRLRPTTRWASAPGARRASHEVRTSCSAALPMRIGGLDHSPSTTRSSGTSSGVDDPDPVADPGGLGVGPGQLEGPLVHVHRPDRGLGGPAGPGRRRWGRTRSRRRPGWPGPDRGGRRRRGGTGCRGRCCSAENVPASVRRSSSRSTPSRARRTRPGLDRACGRAEK